MRNYEDIFQAARQAHMEILPEVYAAFGKRNRCCNCLRYKSERGFFHERLHRLWHAFKGLWVFKRSGGLLLEQYQIAAKGVGVLVHTDEGDQRLNEGDSSYLRRAKTRLRHFLFRHPGSPASIASCRDEHLSRTTPETTLLPHRMRVDQVWSHFSDEGEEWVLLRKASEHNTQISRSPLLRKPSRLLAAAVVDVTFDCSPKAGT